MSHGKGNAVTAATRAVVFERAWGQCERCGTPSPDGQAHHRQPRGMGGTRRREAHNPSNLLWLHPGCHADVESHREHAVRNGWIVPRGCDPADTPVLLSAWGWALLDDDGNVRPIHIPTTTPEGITQP